MSNARPIGFVTYSGLPALTDDDRLAVAELAAAGRAVNPVSWDDPSVRWEEYGVLVLRSTWDYHKRGAAFREWLAAREGNGGGLWNPPALVRWNMDKRYLRELAALGVPITPTAWLEQGDTATLAAILDRHGWSRAVVKPALSATAFQTWIATPETAEEQQPVLDQMLGAGAVLVQQFEPGITRGEWSIIFLGGSLSHTVLKEPKAGDFRVQKEYGGTSRAAAAPAAVVEAAGRVLSCVPFRWLYARVDLLESGGEVRLMELEMLEPDLFLRHDPGAPARFAAAIVSLHSP